MRCFADTLMTASMTGWEAQRADTPSGRTFVVEKASPRYDFCLDLDGAELRWAVPNGPGLAPGTTRLAIRLAMPAKPASTSAKALPVWDRGTWQAEGDIWEACEKGHVRVLLFGHKLRGEWHLVRMDQGEGDNWVLFKARDEQVTGHTDGSIIDEIPDAALEGRSLDQIAETIDETALRRSTKRA